MNKFKINSAEKDLFIEQVRTLNPSADKNHIRIFDSELNSFAESLFDFCEITDTHYKSLLDSISDRLDDLIRPHVDSPFCECGDEEYRKCTICKTSICGDCIDLWDDGNLPYCQECVEDRLKCVECGLTANPSMLITYNGKPHCPKHLKTAIESSY